MDTVVGIFGRSALEASAMGIPAFSYISPKVLEMSQGKIGHPAIIQTRRETLPKVLNETLNSDYSILSQKARDWVVKYYSYPVIGEQYSKFFDKLLYSNQTADKNTATKMTLKTTQPYKKEISAQTPATNRISDIKSQKIGRNELCPCGSGKKYKKCCLNKAVKQK